MKKLSFFDILNIVVFAINIIKGEYVFGIVFFLIGIVISVLGEHSLKKETKK